MCTFSVVMHLRVYIKLCAITFAVTSNNKYNLLLINHLLITKVIFFKPAVVAVFKIFVIMMMLFLDLD